MVRKSSYKHKLEGNKIYLLIEGSKKELKIIDTVLRSKAVKIVPDVEVKKISKFRRILNVIKSEVIIFFAIIGVLFVVFRYLAGGCI